MNRFYRMSSLMMALGVLSIPLKAQWQMQRSGTTADLRGIHYIGGGVAWASGTNGTVLRTIKDGEAWQICTVPPGAEKLDFRGIQAFDSKTAVVMSAGTGDLSRVYKTTDGCQNWRLVFTNTDAEGFWDALQFSGPDFGVLIGDQVRGRFPLYVTFDAGNTWQKLDKDDVPGLQRNQSIFAASNSSLFIDRRNRKIYFITGGGTTAVTEVSLPSVKQASCQRCLGVSYAYPNMAIGDTAGGFALGARAEGSTLIVVAVGGDYKAPARRAGTAAVAISQHGGKLRWYDCEEKPQGYRSAVGYDAASKTWMAVGPNGTDASNDDGRTWHPLRAVIPGGSDIAGNWNALSLPFVVGPKGRIGKLDRGALK